MMSPCWQETAQQAGQREALVGRIGNEGKGRPLRDNGTTIPADTNSREHYARWPLVTCQTVPLAHSTVLSLSFACSPVSL